MSDALSPKGLDLPGDARAMLEAVVAISSDLDLHAVLDRIVESACTLTGARYGALGVLDRSARTLADFITHGLTDEEYRAIGDLPQGRGVLGLLIDHPEPIRLEHLSDHPRSFGFPEHHPPMDSFLGVPVRVRGTVFGNLYLTDKQGGAGFTAQDETLVQVFATAAGFVIENARAYAQSERRRQWLEASVQINEALQPPVDIEAALQQIAIGARKVVTAAAVAVLRRDEDGVQVLAQDGVRAGELPPWIEALDSEISDTESSSEARVVVVPDGTAVGLVRLRAHVARGGVLLVALGPGRTVLEPEELELLHSLADQASLALDRAQALEDRHELMLVADRDRIARDLHDLVIQRLFATGLQLQGVRRIAAMDEVRQRLDAAVADLDATIRDIRSTIFDLQHGGERSLRAEIRQLAREYVPVLGFTPLVRTNGPLDTVADPELADQLLAVLREALSNVARHAEARAAVVDVEASAESIRLRVTDDGKGLPADRRESGLRNARRRAADRGGSLRLTAEEPAGTTVEWWVPAGPGSAGDR